MDCSQIENINSFRYGSMMMSSSGTGKTRAMIAKLIKIARLYPKDDFAYITFDKQLSNDIGSDKDASSGSEEHKGNKLSSAYTAHGKEIQPQAE